MQFIEQVQSLSVSGIMVLVPTVYQCRLGGTRGRLAVPNETFGRTFTDLDSQ